MSASSVASTARELRFLDPVVRWASERDLAFSEAEALSDLWDEGEEVGLHEDLRFRRTPSGLWQLTRQELANGLLRVAFFSGKWDGRGLKTALAELRQRRNRLYLFDPHDPLFRQVAQEDRWVVPDLPVRVLPTLLAAGESESTYPVELLSLRAAAGRLGAQQSTEGEGWVLLREPAPARSFVLRVQGVSMEPKVPDGSYALFKPGEATSGVVLAVQAEGEGSDLVGAWVKEAREEAGQLVLRSLNPDSRSQDPVAKEGDELIRIVATLSRVLGPSELELGESSGTAMAGARASVERDPAKCLEALQKARQRGGDPAGPFPDPTPEAATGAPTLVLDAANLKLHLRLPPLPDLAKAVKKLSVAGARMPLRARNLRHAASIAVKPQHSPYTWTVKQWIGEPDRETGERLGSLGHAGLPAERASVFRAPAGGASGSLLPGEVVSSGRTYRFLIPPGLHVEGGFPDWLEHLGELGGWQVYEGRIPDPELAGVTITGLGLGLSERLAFDLAVARSGYRPVLGAKEAAIVVPHGEVLEALVCAPEVLSDDHAFALLATSAGNEFVSLTGGTRWAVELSDLPPGQAIFEVTARDSALAPARVTLEVTPEPQAPLPPSAEIRFSIAGETVDLLRLDPRDLRPLLRDVSVQAPPLWPLRLRWSRKPGAWSEVLLYADAGGAVDLLAPLSEVESDLDLATSGSVEFDAGELGCFSLTHEVVPDPGELVPEIQALIAEAKPGTAPVETLRDVALPVLRLLGYSSADRSSAEEDHAEVVVESQLVAGVRALVRVVPEGAVESHFAAAGVKRVAHQRGVARLIVTDGREWSVYEPQRYLRRVRTISLAGQLSAESPELLRALEDLSA